MSRATLVFHVHLVQDVGVLRPLIRLAHRLDRYDILVLCAPDFPKLDASGVWAAELAEFCGELGIIPTTYESPYDARNLLGRRRGMVIAGSESCLSNHASSHALFRALPSEFLRVTLQHGFECVGFLHNAAHDATAGRSVRFAADILVGWFKSERLVSLSPAERSKLYVAGPPMLIEERSHAAEAAIRLPEVDRLEGLVCENLHSVRFGSDGVRQDFIQDFANFAERLRPLGSPIHLRPHPAGNFTIRKGVPVPEGVTLSAAPLYKIALQNFGFAISAPSSVLFDFVLAGVPVAVWRDAVGRIDCSNFSGLETVVTTDDWWRFVARCATDPRPVLQQQSRFISELALPDDIEGRYARLFAMA